MEDEYNKLVEWAISVIICFELNSASLVGAANGYSQLIEEKQAKGQVILDAEYAQLGALVACVEKRAQELKQYVDRLNALSVPIPDINSTKLEATIKDRVEKATAFIKNAQPDDVKASMAKIMKDIDKVKVDE